MLGFQNKKAAGKNSAMSHAQKSNMRQNVYETGELMNYLHSIYCIKRHCYRFDMKKNQKVGPFLSICNLKLKLTQLCLNIGMIVHGRRALIYLHIVLFTVKMA